MNTANNQRFQETDRRIRGSMLQLLQTLPLEKITVGALCQMSGCNRSTFYAHFLDTYDLMDKIQLEIYRDLKEKFEGRTFLADRMVRADLLVGLLAHIADNRFFYRAYLASGRAELEQPKQMLYQQYFQPYFARLGFDLQNEWDSRQAGYYFRFFFDGMLSVIGAWLEEDCPESPEQLAGIIWKSIAPVPAELTGNENPPDGRSETASDGLKYRFN